MEARARLLVVDDDPDVLVVLKTKLEGTGRFDVVTATGGADALHQVRERKPDLIVSDIDMPEIDGGELAARLRETPDTADVPVVFLSALVSPDDSGQGAVRGWPMLSKRSSIETLIHTIETMLSDRR